MKRSAALCFPLPVEPLGLAAVVVALALAPGCVTRATHTEVVRERDQYREESARQSKRIELLETSNEALSEERVALIDEIEDLRKVREGLQEKVEGLDRERSELETDLRERESEVSRYSEELQQLRQTYGELVSDLQSDVAAGRIEIERLREGLRLNLAQEVLFAPGSAQLTARGRGMIGKLAERLARNPQLIEVRGHTDDRGISGALAGRYPSNWELAGARAASVVRLLAERGVAPQRMRAVSFGEFRPVVPNDTPEGRARNRRIEIRLLPAEGARAAEAESSGAPAEAPSSAVAEPTASPAEASAPVVTDPPAPE
jgi:chemotaxis protein MotB